MVCAAIAPGTARELPNEKQLCFVRFLSGAPNREMPAAARSTWSQLSTCCLRLFMQKKRKKKKKRTAHTPPRRHIYKRARGPSGVFVSRVCEHLFRIRQPGIFRECRLQRPECPPPPISQPPGLSHVWMQTNSHQNKQTR